MFGFIIPTSLDIIIPRPKKKKKKSSVFRSFVLVDSYCIKGFPCTHVCTR